MNDKIIIPVAEIVPSTITNSDAVSLKSAMQSVLAKGDIIVLSFHKVNTITSSFLNSSIGEIIEEYGFDKLKGRLVLSNYTPPVGEMITKYINDLRNLVH